MWLVGTGDRIYGAGAEVYGTQPLVNGRQVLSSLSFGSDTRRSSAPEAICQR